MATSRCDITPGRKTANCSGSAFTSRSHELLGVGVARSRPEYWSRVDGRRGRSARRKHLPADRRETGRPDEANRPTRSQAAGFRRATGWRRPARSAPAGCVRVESRERASSPEPPFAVKIGGLDDSPERTGEHLSMRRQHAEDGAELFRWGAEQWVD